MDVFSLVGDITVRYTEAVKGIDQVQKAAASAGEDLNGLDRSADATGQELDSLGKEADATGQELDSLGEESDSAGEELDSLGEEADSAGQDMDSMGQEADATGSNLDSMGQEADSAGQELGSLGQQANSAGKDLQSLGQTSVSVGTLIKGNLAGNAITSVFTTAWSAITSSIDGAIQRYDTLNNYTTVMENLGYSTEDAERAMSQLSDGIQGLPTTLNSIVSWQQQYTALSGEIDGATDLTLALNDATLAAGQGQETANSAMQQWYQILANGKPDQQSWNILCSAMPAQMQQIAQSLLGANAQSQDLFDAWKDGTVTTEQVQDAIIDLDQNGGSSFASFQQQALDANGGIETSMTNLTTKITNGVASIIESYNDWATSNDMPTIQEAIESLKDAIGNAFDYISENFDSLMETFIAISPAIAAVTAAVVAFQAAMAISSLVQGVSSAIKAYQTANEGATVAQALLNTTILANPFALIVTLIAAVVAAIVGLWNTNDGFRDAVTSAWETVKSAISTAVEAVGGFISGLVDTFNDIKDKIMEVFSNIYENISSVLDQISETISSVWSAISSTISTILTGISTTFSTIWNAIKSTITSVINGISSTISSVWNAIKSTITSIMNSISSTFSSVWNAIKSAISSVINAISSTISSVFNSVKSTITSIMNSIKSTFTSVWNGIKSSVSSVVNGIKSVITTGLNGAKSSVTNILNSIKNAFSNIMNSAKNVVSNAINAIKSKFNFSWSLPKLKLPHISISGEFSLAPPSVPKFGIEWYAKAMEEGMIMNEPTIFGVNANGQLMAGGEKGSETVVGTDSLMQMVQAAVDDSRSASNEEIVEILSSMSDWLESGKFRDLMVDILTKYVTFELNDREVGRLVRNYA